MLELKSEFGIEPVLIVFGGNQYYVYSDGRVFSYNKKKFLSVHDNGKGYKYVGIYDSTSSRSLKQYVHRLVATCYIENTKGLTDVNHIDFNKSNNTVVNLEWVSRAENMEHAWNGDRFNDRQLANKEVRDSWLGEICGNRKIIKVTEELAPSKNYYVFVECLLCGNDTIKMAQNDFKKGRAKTCKQCKNKSPC